jgi:ATP-dependent helicase YprA (DUF1998 family)
MKKRAARRHGRENKRSPSHRPAKAARRGEAALRPLSEQRRRFVEAFMGTSHGNARQAALTAGYSQATAGKQGSRLLTFVDVRRAIAERAKSDPAVWQREDLQAWWTAVVSGASPHKRAALGIRLKASELLGRSQAVFTDNVAHSGKLTLEQALTASRQKSTEAPGA